jgi:hypothetical protein
MATFLGGIISVLGLVLAVYFALLTFVWGRDPEGWASVIVAVLFIGGTQLIGIGAIGEYIGRIFITQMRARSSRSKRFTARAVQTSKGKPSNMCERDCTSNLIRDQSGVKRRTPSAASVAGRARPIR